MIACLEEVDYSFSHHAICLAWFGLGQATKSNAHILLPLLFDGRPWVKRYDKRYDELTNNCLNCTSFKNLSSGTRTTVHKKQVFTIFSFISMHRLNHMCETSDWVIIEFLGTSRPSAWATNIYKQITCNLINNTWCATALITSVIAIIWLWVSTPQPNLLHVTFNNCQLWGHY